MTKVCITVDVECNIGGAFRDASLFPVGEQALWCMVAGRSEGLGFLLETFAVNQITGTFFLETMNSHYFKESPMKKAAERIAGGGHELQLHTHPCWSIFKHADWRLRCQGQRHMDDFFGLQVDAAVALIRESQSIFQDWQLPVPTVFRSGNLQHDDSLYQALSRCGIPYSSSVGLGVFNSGDPGYQLYSGQHLRHGIVELPVLSFKEHHLFGKPGVKTLTITGTSFDETKALLEDAEKAGLPQVVILTHPFEFIQKKDSQYSVTRRHAVNQRRLRKLCQFLAKNRDRFPTVGLATAAREVTLQTSNRNVALQTTPCSSGMRNVSNLVYQRFGSLMLNL